MNTDIIIIEEALIKIKRCSGINRPLTGPVTTRPFVCADPAFLVTQTIVRSEMVLHSFYPESTNLSVIYSCPMCILSTYIRTHTHTHTHIYTRMLIQQYSIFLLTKNNTIILYNVFIFIF